MKATSLVPLLLLTLPLTVSAQQSGRPKFTIIQDGKRTEIGNHRPAEPLTNQSIIKLVRAKLGEDTIINIVNSQPGRYAVGADDIVALKKAGASDKIIAAIVNKQSNAPAVPAPHVVQSEQSNEPAAEPEHRPATVQSPKLGEVESPGLYYDDRGTRRAIIGQAVVFRRTGSLLAGTLTLWIVSGKINIKIPGKHSGTHLGSQPIFYYHAGPDEPPGVVTLILSRLKETNGDRQLEARASGVWRTSEGISINSQVPANISLDSPGIYKIESQTPLKTGEYVFYLRTAGASTQDAFLYAFSVE